MKTIIVFVALCVGASVAASVTSLVAAAIDNWTLDKPCPVIDDVKTNFDTNAFVGKWYNPERYGHPYEMSSICSSVEYQLKNDNNFEVTTDGINEKTGEKVTVTFKAALSDPTAEPLLGKFNVTVFELERVNYILDTDYKTWAMGYDCKPMEDDANKSTQLYWLMTRSPEPLKDEVALARIAELKAKYLDEKLVKPVVFDPAKCKFESFRPSHTPLLGAAQNMAQVA